MCEIKVREASREDLQKVYEIEKGSFKDPYPLAYIEFLYDINRRTFLIAEKGGTAVGYIIASAEKDLGHIISIATHPLERGKEVGRSLMSKVLKILEAAGVTTVRLEVRKSNVEAQKFYEFLGFKSSHSIENYYGDEDALVYFKLL